MPYQAIKLKISKDKQRKALNGGSIRLSKDEIGVGQDVYLHPMNMKKINNAKNGVMLTLSPGEIMMTAEKHGIVSPETTELSGSGFFDSIWNGIKRVGSFLKDSGIATTLADAAVPAIAGFLGPAGATAARGVVKNLTGVGVEMKKKPKKTMKGSGLYI